MTNSLRAENVIAMSWPQGLSLRLETAPQIINQDVDAD